MNLFSLYVHTVSSLLRTSDHHHSNQTPEKKKRETMLMMMHMDTLAASSTMAVLLLLSWLPLGTMSTLQLHDQQSNQLLKSDLNKPALRSIKSPDGDTMDCVDINDQPALRDPLLRNHTIQMRPNYRMVKTLSNSMKKIVSSVTQSWQLGGINCPKGTIPIRRTNEEEISRASFLELEPYGFPSSFSSYHREGALNDHKTYNRKVKDAAEVEYSIGLVEGEAYYGAKTILNPWKPRVKRTEYSTSQIWIGSSTYDGIGAGWHVFPILYGNEETRLFTFTRFNKTNYCFNLLCTGFVQTTNKYAIGGAITPTSRPGAALQRELKITIRKVPSTGRWWLQVGKQWLGYWPSSLFKGGLAHSATQILFGGQVANSGKRGKNKKRHTLTQMGSGALAWEGFGKASYFRNIQIVPATPTPQGGYMLVDANFSATLVTSPSCYDLVAAHDRSDKNWGTYFYYGGPGKNSKCP